MTIEDALKEADFLAKGCGVDARTAATAITLADEVRRLRTAAETLQSGLMMGLAVNPNPKNPGAFEGVQFVLDRGRELGLFAR